LTIDKTPPVSGKTDWSNLTDGGEKRTPVNNHGSPDQLETPISKAASKRCGFCGWTASCLKGL